jgi:hypothetical protein
MIQIEIDKEIVLPPAYQKKVVERAFWQASYCAHHDYAFGKDASGHPIIGKHDRENDTRYRERLNKARVWSFCKTIGNAYFDKIQRTPVSRAPVETYPDFAEFSKDCDDMGTSLADFMYSALKQAQILGRSFILVDSTASLGVPVTKADEEAEGVRPFLNAIHPDSVIDYRIYRGRVVEAMIVMIGETGEAYIWHAQKTKNTKIELDQKKFNDTPTQLVPTSTQDFPHNYGCCPVVLLEPADGASVLEAPAESQKRRCELDTWEWVELRQATFTTMVFLGMDPASISGALVDVGSDKAICLPSNANGQIPQYQKMGSDPAQADSLRKSSETETKEMYRCAGLSPGNPTEIGTPESGVARGYKVDDVRALLATLAKCAQVAETQLMGILKEIGCCEEECPDPKWPTEFDIPLLQAELEACLRTWQSDLPDSIRRDSALRFADARRPAMNETERATLVDELKTIPKREPPPAPKAGNLSANPAQ